MTKVAHAKKSNIAPTLALVTVIVIKNYQKRIPKEECRQNMFDKNGAQQVEWHP